METFIQIGYRRKDSVEILESRFLSEDAKYLYLEAGKFLKKRIVSMHSRIKEEEGDEDEE